MSASTHNVLSEAGLAFRILEPSEWPLVAPVVTGEFRNSMPVRGDQSSFLAAFDGESLAGFVHVETLFHINCVFVKPCYRRAGLGLALLAAAAGRVPQGFSAIAIAPRSPELLARFLGARPLGRQQIFRRDF